MAEQNEDMRHMPVVEINEESNSRSRDGEGERQEGGVANLFVFLTQDVCIGIEFSTSII